MSRYDQDQLKTLLQGATPLQSLSGKGGVIAGGLAALGIDDSAPQTQIAAPAAQNANNAAWNTVLKGPEL